MNAMLNKIVEIWDKALEVWISGGWAMVAIVVIALVMFGLGLHVSLMLRAKNYRSVPESTWRRWIDTPSERKGPIGDLLDFAVSGKETRDMRLSFAQLRAMETVPFDRDLRVMKICVSAAPLLGLLGTVTGMLATFGALATGSGGDKTMALVAEGISEALVTTMTGLVIALAGLFFHYLLVRKYERYKGFLTQLETVCTQAGHRNGNGNGNGHGNGNGKAEVYRALRHERAVAAVIS